MAYPELPIGENEVLEDECEECGEPLSECVCDDADDEENDDEFAPGAIGEYRY
jgi:hypothetical protein